MDNVNKEEFQNSLTHHMTRGGAIVLSFAFLATPIGYFTRMLYSRSLSIEMFGLIYAMIAFFALLSSFNDLGFGYSVSYLVPKFIKKHQKRKAWNTYKYDQIIEVSTALLLSFILFFSADFLAEYYFKVDIAADIIKILLFYFVAESVISAMNKFFIGLQQEGYYSSIQVVRLGLVLFFSTIFFMSGRSNIVWYAIAWSLAHLMTADIYRFILHKKNSTLVHKVSWDKPLFLKMLQYALPTLFVSSLGLISRTMDNMLLVLFEDLTQVGIYNIVISLALISPIFLSPLSNIIFPLISKLEDEPAKLKKLIEVLLKIIPFVAFYFAFFIFLFPEPILQTMFGSKWMNIAKSPLQIAVLVYILNPISNLFSIITNGLGLIAEKTKISSALLTLKLILVSISTYLFGLNGMLLSSGLVFTASILAHYSINRKKGHYSLPIKTYMSLIGIGLIIYIITRLIGFMPHGIIELILTGAIYTAIYIIFGFSLGIVDHKSILLIVKNRNNFK